MRRTLKVALGMVGLAAVAGGLAACGEEDPTGVGSELIGPGITTFEVVLDGAAFLLEDTTYDSLGELSDAGFRLVANDFAGELDAHTLFEIQRPFTVVYAPEEGGPSTTDSLAAIRGARVTVIVDTIGTTAGPIELEVLPVTESWDAGSVTWNLRYDTAGVSEPWTEPGGTTGPVAGSALWESGDTLVIPIDSASAAVWQDTVAARRGALVRAATPDARLRLRAVRFEFDVVPREQTDTVVSAGSIIRSMHVATPDAPPVTVGELRVGGLPSWRALLRFRPLEDLVLDSCGGGLGTGDPDCDVPLAEATLSLATLLLDPVPVGGHRIELPSQMHGRAILPAPGIPIFRSPLSGPVGFMQDTIPVSLFTPTPPAGVRVAVPITGFVRQLVAGVDPDDEDAVPPSEWLALVSTLERATFGYMGFASAESATPPRLRLVVSVPNREVFE